MEAHPGAEVLNQVGIYVMRVKQESMFILHEVVIAR